MDSFCNASFSDQYALGSVCEITGITTSNFTDCDSQETMDWLDDTFTADVTVEFTDIPAQETLS